MLYLSEKEFFDFTLSADILFKSQGIGGIAFHMRDEFNYYAFMIDKNLGHKAIVKVQNNKVTILKMINDGGILIDNWHTVTITVKAGLISVYIYDKETSSKTESEKKIQIEDHTFSSGSAGFFINGLAGFYFDELKVKPLECFSSWQPNPNIDIRNVHTNIYVEDFKGNINEKYTIIDIEEDNNRNGPSKWEIIDDNIGEQAIRQDSLVFDASSYKRPSMSLINYVSFQNGVFKSVFNPSEENGTISLILKYNQEQNQSVSFKEEFYSFDIVNEENESYYTFRKWSNGACNIIHRFVIDDKTSKLVKTDLRRAYIPNSDNWVIAEVINQKFTIKISQNGTDYATIFNLKDESITSGTAGFGTYKTKCDFKNIYIEPTRIKLTQKDIDYIMVNTLEDIPMPSVIDLYHSGTTSSCSRDKNFSELTAINTLFAYSSILGSTLGNDNCGDGSSSSNTSITINNQVTIDQTNITISEGNQWKTCVVNRSQSDRQKYCSDNFDSELMKKRCEVKIFS